VIRIRQSLNRTAIRKLGHPDPEYRGMVCIVIRISQSVNSTGIRQLGHPDGGVGYCVHQ
jgi:hypothetical protein